MEILLSSVSFDLPVQECSGLPICFGTNQNAIDPNFGPFDFEVL